MQDNHHNSISLTMHMRNVLASKPIKAAVLAASFALTAGNAFAEPFGECFTVAANAYKIPRHILVAIAKVESGFKADAYNRNANGTADIGIMQINSSHISYLEKHGIDGSLLWDPCSNIKIGAWVLATQMRQHGKTWRAVGAYNAKTEAKRRAYVHKVWVALREGGS